MALGADDVSFRAGMSSVYLRMELWEQVLFMTGGACAIAACVASGMLIYQHLRFWSDAPRQKWIVRILIMVPIYSVDSWFSLRFNAVSTYLNLIRDAYEGYGMAMRARRALSICSLHSPLAVLFCFFALLIAYVEGNRPGSCGQILASKGPKSHPWPLTCIHFTPGPYFLLWMKRLILQFAILRPLLAIVAVCLEPFGLFGEGSLAVNRGYLYFTVLGNVSVSIALYCLILFYIAAKEELEQFQPIAKFFSIKAILFFAFWQSVLIAILAHFGILSGIGSWTEHQVAVLFQDLAICFEMFFLSILHIFAFEFQTYREKMQVKPSKLTSLRPVLKNFGETVSQNDVLGQVKESFLDRSAGRAARRASTPSPPPDERTKLIASSDDLPDAKLF